MPDKPNNHRPDTDQRLYELIRKAEDEFPDEFTRPDEDDITAYLMGTSSEEQNARIRKALLASRAFRREILGLAEEIERIKGRYDRTVPVIPLWERIGNLFLRRKLVPVLAAAAVLILVMVTVTHKPDGPINPETWTAVTDSTFEDLYVTGKAPGDSLLELDDTTKQQPPPVEDRGFEYAWREAPGAPWGIPAVEGCIDVRATGYAPFIDDERAAYRVAVRHAFYDAVSRALEGQAGTPPAVRNFSDVASLIFDGRRGYVADWRETDLGAGEGNRYAVRVDATFCPGGFPDGYETRVMHLMNRAVLGNPRVLVYFLGGEDDEGRQYDLITEFAGALIDAGFRVFEPAPTGEDRRFFTEAFDLGSGALKVGKWSESECDIVIGIKTEFADPRPSEFHRTKGWTAVDFTVAYRTLIPGTGRIIQADFIYQTGIGKSVMQARSNAVEKATRMTIEELIYKMPGALVRYPKGIAITCQSCAGETWDMIGKRIADIPDVYSVRSIEWDENLMSGEMEAQIDPIVGSTDLLWRHLSAIFGDSLLLEAKDEKRIAVRVQI
jgi:hypothetical protein